MVMVKTGSCDKGVTSNWVWTKVLRPRELLVIHTKHKDNKRA